MNLWNASCIIQHNYCYNFEVLHKKNKLSDDSKKKEKNLKDTNNSSMIKLLLGATESSAYVLNSYQVTLKSWLHWFIYSFFFFFFLARVSFFLKGFRDLWRSFVRRFFRWGFWVYFCHLLFSFSGMNQFLFSESKQHRKKGFFFLGGDRIML